MFSQPFLIQTVGTKPIKASKQVPASNAQTPPLLYLVGEGVVILALVAVVVYGKILLDQAHKKLKFEQFRTRELEKKFKLALETIRKMETNPDLVNSRDFNLDYLRMRMSEEVFHFAVVNQIKVQIKDKITQVLRPSQAQQGQVGIATNTSRQIDEIFDVEYETGTPPNMAKRVLFRIQVKLMKLPTQPTSNTISQLIECIETYLSPLDDEDNWQPTIQGRVVFMHWDQKAKPTPLLVLEQSNEGVNVTFRTNRQNNTPAPPPPPSKQNKLKQSGMTRK
jgi:hypothetical protein